LLFIYIPTYRRSFWLQKQLDRLAPQIVKYAGRVNVLVNNNALEDLEFEGIVQKYRHISAVQFRSNPGNIMANANITLGFVFAGPDDFLWILSDDDIVTDTALDAIIPVIDQKIDFVHIGNYRVNQTMTISRDNLFSEPKGAGFGLISVVVFNMRFVRNQLFNGFEYIESSFPHLAITLAALRERGSGEVACIPADGVFSYEGALTDGDYTQSQLGYGYLADFFELSARQQFLWSWISVSWQGFFQAKNANTLLNNRSRFSKSYGYIVSYGIKFRVLLVITRGLYGVKKMLIQLHNKIRYWLNKAHQRVKNIGSLGNDGERLDMKFEEGVDFNGLDIYEKSHLRRYEYALKIIVEGACVGDFACGTGYGTVLLSKKASKVFGVDLSAKTIDAIRNRYKKNIKVEFVNKNLLHLEYKNKFDCVVSFETVEHLEEDDIPLLFEKFNHSLKIGGQLILSTPYMQETPPPEVELNYHLTHEIDESKISFWLSGAGFEVVEFKYQNFINHEIVDDLKIKDMIICVARKL
jgi:2-polyprenyl-3-methyl-5-hydroxy-6-metoxy-1,4-benzoquinol methylase